MILDDLEAEAGKSGGILAMLNTEGHIYVGKTLFLVCYYANLVSTYLLIISGGVPDLATMTAGRHTKNFAGCISDIKFNNKLVDFMLDHEGGFNVKQCESERFTY